jgi:predicted RNA-binding Zn ribbon-like protein
MDEFRFGYGAPWLDLLATLRMRRRPPEQEYLTDPAALQAWLRAEKLQPVSAPTGAQLDAFVELREALYLLARSSLEGTRPPAAAVQALNAALRYDTPPQLSATADGVQARRPADATVALGRIAREAAETLTGPARERLRPCGDDTCGGIFLDDSGRRRWCSDAQCGSRARVRAHRARVRGQ